MFGDIAKSVTKILGPQGLPVGKLLTGVLSSSVFKSDQIGNLLKGVGPLLNGLANQSPGNLKAALDRLAPVIDKAAFIGILQGAAAKAGEQTAFNLETAINDLWVKLDNLRRAKSAPGGAANPNADPVVNAQADLEQLTKMVTEMQKRVHELSKGVIGNIR